MNICDKLNMIWGGEISTKNIKNGIESENNYNNGSDSTYNKYDLSFSNKNKIGGEKNRVKASNILNY